MKLSEDVSLIDGLPIAYIKSINALAIADMHLGYEALMAKNGIFAPKVNLKKIIEMLSKAVEITKASSIVVDGDIKNEFSTVEPEEFNELYDFINFAKSIKVDLYLIKGNHDNFVERYKEPFKLKVARQQLQLGRYLFFHGEEMPDLNGKDIDMLIMGHEHPSIGITDDMGRREKLRCFLYGRYKKSKLLVLPAIGYFASGSDILAESPESMLSPIFKHIDVDSMHAIAIGYGSTIDFGAVGKLRSL